MTNPTIGFDECKQLKEWGLPQELKVGDWYYGWSKQTNSWDFCSHTTGPINHYEKYYKYPNLEVLMKFARKLETGWIIVANDKGWCITHWDENEMFFDNPNLLYETV